MLSRPRLFPRVFLSAFAGLILTVQGHASDIHSPEAAPEMDRVAVNLRFDLYRGYFIVAHGSAGPLKNLNFFLDTGTTITVLDSRVARKLDLQTEGPSKIVIIGGRAPGAQSHLPSLELGPLRRSSLPVITTDLSFFERDFPVRIDGIIGLDVLGQTPFMIDYSAHVIRFGEAPNLPRSVPLRLAGGMAIFDARVDDAPVHLLFDTGAFSLILFAKESPHDSEVKNDVERKQDEIGSFQSKQVFLGRLTLGAEEFRHEPALLAQNPKPSQLDFDGLMSPAALGISKISVDVQRGVLGFSR